MYSVYFMRLYGRLPEDPGTSVRLLVVLPEAAGTQHVLNVLNSYTAASVS